MTVHERVYRALLRSYPATFRDHYAEEMARLFGEQLRDVRAVHGRFGLAGLWLRSIADIIATAPRHHLRRERPMPEPVKAGLMSGTMPVHSSHRSRSRLMLGLMPIWLLLFLSIATPGFMDPLFANPPELVGLPLGIFVIVGSVALTVMGLMLLRRTESDLVVVITFLLFTIPAALLLVLGPAAILLVINGAGPTIP